MKKLPLLLALACLFMLGACSKTDENGTAQVTVRLTDGPAAYDHVYIDIQKVEVTMEGSSAVNIAPVRPGIYDILDFRNGLDTLLFRANLPAGKVGQIRLILGTNNSVVANGVSYPLNTPSAQESGLKLNLHESFEANGAYTIWIDFDAAKSIVVTGNGSYKLKPVIRAYSETTNGQIKGYVLPLTAGATVYAASGTDTLSAIPASADGYFKISGIPAGTYKVWVNPAAGSTLLPFAKTGIQVVYGTQVDLGTITLVP